jgi:hypothetical protein
LIKVESKIYLAGGKRVNVVFESTNSKQVTMCINHLSFYLKCILDREKKVLPSARFHALKHCAGCPCGCLTEREREGGREGEGDGEGEREGGSKREREGGSEREGAGGRDRERGGREEEGEGERESEGEEGREGEGERERESERERERWKQDFKSHAAQNRRFCSDKHL